MRQITKVRGEYRIFNLANNTLEVINTDWKAIAGFIIESPDIYVVDSSVKYD